MTDKKLCIKTDGSNPMIGTPIITIVMNQLHMKS